MIAPTQLRQNAAFAYARVSDNKQVDTGNSLPEQILRMEAYYRVKLAEKGVVWGGTEYDGFGVSASKKAFCDRPAGKRIMGKLQPGDHVIVDALDRIWRDPRDFENLLHWFKSHDITLHIVQMDIVAGPIDTAGPIGELTLRIFVAVARAESQRNSERHIRHYEAARKQGFAATRYAPAGTRKVWKIYQGKKRKFLEWDPHTRGIMAEIVEMHDVQKMTYDAIGWELESRGADESKRPFRRSAFFKRYWTPGKVTYYYQYEVYYRDHHITDVRNIPSQFQKTVSDYMRSQGFLRRRSSAMLPKDIR